MSNRLEELESQITELQAAVNGLTEELVETKERLHLIEDNIEIDLSAGSRSVGHEADEAAQSQESRTTDTDANSATDAMSQDESKSTAASDSDASDNESTDDSDIIIA